jgi:ectoine hydroxylase-related dioxygenase (phytanoyl-CoA dioxygenase family)
MNQTLSPTLEQELFQNSATADTLRNEGVVHTPFLTPDELRSLQEYYAHLHGSNDPPTMYDGIHMTIWHSDTNYKLAVHNKLKEIFNAACERNFSNYRAISHQFIIKRKGEETTFPVHQDWSIVDESKYISLNIWIPLQDVNEKNGAMSIIKRSHNIDRKVRGAGYLFPNYHVVLDGIKPHLTSYNLKAGEALIFYHRTIHGSPPNLSDEPRVVVQLTVLPKEAPFEIYFQKNPGDKLQVHHPKDDFNFYYERIREDSETKPPTNSPTETREPFRMKEVTLNEVLSAIN